jgi:hypothetical protein
LVPRASSDSANGIALEDARAVSRDGPVEPTGEQDDDIGSEPDCERIVAPSRERVDASLGNAENADPDPR